MVISQGLLKNIDFLREQMSEIKHKYRIAFRVGFWVPLGVFALEIFYYACLAVMLSVAYLGDLFGEWDVPDEKMKFVPNLIFLLMPLVYLVVSFISFKLKVRTTKYLLLIINAFFFALCIVMIVKGWGEWYLYAAAMLYTLALFIACIDCIKADQDEAILSKIDGYPHFNPVLINEELSMHSEIKFPDKKSYDELYEERLEKYAEENPDTEMAQLYRKEKEEKLDSKLGDWLDDMFVKK